jgi:hypothetical protein
MTNIINQVAYIKSSREFPADLGQIANILTRSYPEIAAAINERTIGLFPITRPAVTGNAYYLFRNQKQQSLREVYTFTSTAPIDHGINFNEVSYIGAMYGQYTDGTNWYGIIPGTSIAIPGQLVFYLSPTQIIFVPGGGTMPALTKGIIVIEWISQP